MTPAVYAGYAAPPSEAEPTPPPRGRGDAMDLAAFAVAVHDRRTSNGLSQRQAAAEADVSFSTWSRVEAGHQPDLASFSLICAWLHVPAGTFFAPVAERETSGLEQAITHLQADPHLPADAAQKISAVLRDLYNALATQTAPRGDLVACHLRAASTLRPGVPERLGGLLRDMHDELTRRADAGRL